MTQSEKKFSEKVKKKAFWFKCRGRRGRWGGDAKECFQKIKSWAFLL